MRSRPDYDVIIAGGGLVGSSLALALASESFQVAVVEAVTPVAVEQPSFDDRGIALSLSSRHILDGLGVWPAVEKAACPVRKIHVSDQNHFGFVRLHADDMQVPALGYVVLARELGKVLMQQVAASDNIDLLSPAIVDDIAEGDDCITARVSQNETIISLNARLLVAADGTNSKLRTKLGIKSRQKDYGQTAIVTNVGLSGDHQQMAYERFTLSGPLALLPMIDNRYAVVFTVNSEDESRYCKMSDAEFLQSIVQRLGHRTGPFLRLGTRKSYPLVSILAREQFRQRLLVLGNAAHTIHPNGAQGFNLCLRDVAGLLEVLAPAFHSGADIGQGALLREYLSLRKFDQNLVEQFSDSIASIFYNSLPHKVFIRNSAMVLLDLIPPLKRAFMQRTMGLSGRQPYLVRSAIS